MSPPVDEAEADLLSIGYNSECPQGNTRPHRGLPLVIAFTVAVGLVVVLSMTSGREPMGSSQMSMQWRVSQWKQARQWIRGMFHCGTPSCPHYWPLPDSEGSIVISGDSK
jgi:hypothetical protein